MNLSTRSLKKNKKDLNQESLKKTFSESLKQESIKEGSPGDKAVNFCNHKTELFRNLFSPLII